MMRHAKPLLAGALGLVAVAACGLPPAARDGTPVRATGPQDPARRYQVLGTTPLCPPSPDGTATPGNCTSFAGRDGTIFLRLVDRTPSDIGEVSVSYGDEIVYLATNPSIVIAPDGFGNPQATITGSFSGIWTGLPEDAPETIDPLFLTIRVNLGGVDYAIDAEESRYDTSGSFTVLLIRQETCDLIPASELFPSG